MRLISTLLLSLFPFFAESATPLVLDPTPVMKYAETNLPHTGTLEKTEDGYVYLKVSNSYITSLLPLLHDKTIQAPPYFGPGKMGAHITLILPGEIDWENPPQFPEWGTQIPFNLSHFVSVTPDKRPGFPYTQPVEAFYLFTLEAPALESLRLVAGLPPRINGYDFHITVGVTYAVNSN